LSKYFVDSKGERQPNLVPLCNQCHNAVHDKLGEWQRKDKFTNTELW
jgi:5-methylcytosine-specific restriction endonuclease McrA